MTRIHNHQFAHNGVQIYGDHFNSNRALLRAVQRVFVHGGRLDPRVLQKAIRAARRARELLQIESRFYCYSPSLRGWQVEYDLS